MQLMLCPELLQVVTRAVEKLLFNSEARWSFSAASLMIKIYAVKTSFLLYATVEHNWDLQESLNCCSFCPPL